MEPRPPGLIGTPVRRREDGRLLTGRGRFVADLAPPGALHAAFLRSPYAHARLGASDARSLHDMPGVAGWMDGEALSRLARPMRAESRMATYRATDWPALARGKVRHVGEAVAVVVAESRYLAEDAAEAIRVEYEPLPAVPDPAAAMAAGAPLVHEAAGSNVLLTRAFAQGDVDGAFGQARLVVRERFRFHRHAGVTLENRGCLAQWDAGREHLTLWSSTQVPGVLRDALTELLDLPEHGLRVVAPDVGGGFGVKSALYPEEIVVCALARRLERPVTWVGDRREDLLTSTQAWDEEIEAELALDGDGRVLALRARIVADVGAYSAHPWTASIEVIQVAGFLPGPYRLPNYRADALGVATTKAPTGPYRGVGRPVSTFVMEGLLDRAARQLGSDPLELRRRNLLRPDELPYRAGSGLVWDSGNFPELLEGAAAAAGYAELRREQARRRAQGRYLGIGVACYVELTGVGSSIPASPGSTVSTGTEGATVRVDPGGTVTATFGTACHGQGHETTLAQVVAEELGTRLDDVRIVHGDTEAAPVGTGTYASRTAVIAGGAAILASRAVRDKAVRIAAHQLEAAVEDVEFAEGRAWVRGSPERSVSVRDIARAAYAGARRLPRGMEPGLEATRYYDPYLGTAASATHVAVVEVDTETCGVRLLRHVVVEDCGRIINPLIVDGQAIGGVAQGIGAALLEELVHAEDGQLLTGTLMDYLVPAAADVPAVEVHHIERPSPTTLGGFKGVGEGGTIGAPAAIANAIGDALAPLGIEVAELPVTPERLFRLLVAARRG